MVNDVGWCNVKTKSLFRENQKVEASEQWIQLLWEKRHYYSAKKICNAWGKISSDNRVSMYWSSYSLYPLSKEHGDTTLFNDPHEGPIKP